MKLVIAIIQPHKLEEVKRELYKAEVNLVTVSEVLGHGRQKGIAVDTHRLAELSRTFLPNFRIRPITSLALSVPPSFW